MAQVKIEDIVEHLSSEMRRALQAAVEEVHPGAQVDPHALFRAFRRAVGRKCNTWEQVPDQFIQH
jgi:hypothetical protein